MRKNITDSILGISQDSNTSLGQVLLGGGAFPRLTQTQYVLTNLITIIPVYEIEIMEGEFIFRCAVRETAAGLGHYYSFFCQRSAGSEAEVSYLFLSQRAK